MNVGSFKSFHFVFPSVSPEKLIQAYVFLFDEIVFLCVLCFWSEKCVFLGVFLDLGWKSLCSLVVVLEIDFSVQLETEAEQFCCDSLLVSFPE